MLSPKIMRKPKATYEDLYNTLSFTKWKTGLELIKELESNGKRAGHFRGTMYVYLAQWEDDGFIRVREREPSDLERENQRKYKYKLSKAREYIRTSTGTPKGIFNVESKPDDGLEGLLVPA